MIKMVEKMQKLKITAGSPGRLQQGDRGGRRRRRRNGGRLKYAEMNPMTCFDESANKLETPWGFVPLCFLLKALTRPVRDSPCFGAIKRYFCRIFYIQIDQSQRDYQWRVFPFSDCRLRHILSLIQYLTACKLKDFTCYFRELWFESSVLHYYGIGSSPELGSELTNTQIMIHQFLYVG